jgi:hypothetical protein
MPAEWPKLPRGLGYHKDLLPQNSQRIVTMYNDNVFDFTLSSYCNHAAVLNLLKMNLLKIAFKLPAVRSKLH